VVFSFGAYLFKTSNHMAYNLYVSIINIDNKL
jgi:hypothetical protein